MLNTMVIKHSGCWIAEEAEEATEELGQMIERRFAATQSKQVVKVVYTREASLPRPNPWV
jgi:hypothetical protein